MEIIAHNCGYFLGHTLHDTYSGLKSLQHRGREVVGIGAIGRSGIDIIKWVGKVERFSLVDLHKIFPGRKYFMYFGHVRYATRGSKEMKQLLKDGHPHIIGGQAIKREDHIMIFGGEMAIVHNGQVNPEYLKDIDLGCLKTGCDSEGILRYYEKYGEEAIMKNIPGSYSMAIADAKKKKVIVMRDKSGIKPGILGLKDGRYSAASEDIAFNDNGGKAIKDLAPGAIYYFDMDGDYEKVIISEPDLSYCMFEYNYIAHVNSILNKVPVQVVRGLLGIELANEYFYKDADVITYLPRCPEVAARAYAEKTKLPLIDVFYKTKDERSFMGPDEKEREDSIKKNLYLMPAINGIQTEKYLQGKKVIVIDDSIIRGNVSKRAKYLLYDVAKVKEAYLLSYTPKVGLTPKKDKIPRGCDFGGVDMPSTDNFIARGRSIRKISEIMGMPVRYLSIKGMLKAFVKAGLPAKNLCTYCIGGKRPF